MIKSSSLLNLPVYSETSGKKQGIIKEIVYTPSNDKIKGFLLNTGVIIKNLKFIKIDDIVNITDKAIFTKDDDCVEDISKYPELVAELTSDQGLIGKNVIGPDGKDLGKVSETVLNTQNNEVVGYLLTDGLIGDLINGRSYVKRSDDMVFDDQNITMKGGQ